MSNLYLSILDKVLRDIKQTTDINPLDLEDHLKSKYKLPNRDVRGVREKLEDDKMIKSFIPVPVGTRFLENRLYQYITFDGLMLLEQYGGYLGKKRKEKRSLIFGIILSVSIAVSSSVAAVYYVIEMFQPYRHNPPQEKVESLDRLSVPKILYEDSSYNDTTKSYTIKAKK